MRKPLVLSKTRRPRRLFTTYPTRPSVWDIVWKIIAVLGWLAVAAGFFAWVAFDALNRG